MSDRESQSQQLMNEFAEANRQATNQYLAALQRGELQNVYPSRAPDESPSMKILRDEPKIQWSVEWHIDLIYVLIGLAIWALFR